ncbi:DUF2341 domain-containing protein [Archaeoglobus neptunius]|uniref:DUF2341 domain-containing protein n=1 Tax=Archaeoglobus neptunius TaxID=2798580 RepID=UPI001928CCB6|nr:DUF2341 domain-containing protein [Archaeoglobus neptunius]
MDSKAVSPLIGFVLLLAIIMGLIGVMQAQLVPAWNRAVEAKHMDELSYEIADLSESISIAASTGNPAKVVVDAGVRYPNYYVLLSPSKGSGTVSSKVLSVNISGIGNYTTSAIVFRPNYFYSPSPELVYEHSAVFKIESSSFVVDSGQSSFSRDRIVIYLVNATFQSFATTGNVNLVVYPISYGGVQRYSGTITFECYSERTAEWWNSTLASIYGSSNVSRTGNTVEVRTSNVRLSIVYLEAYATASGEVEVNEKPQPAKVLKLSAPSYVVYQGVTVPLGVRVVDEYWNPVEGAEVTVSVDGNIALRANTNERGELWYYYQAFEAGTHTIVFSTGVGSVTYTVEVLEKPTSTGIFSVTWDVGDNYTLDASIEGVKEFRVRVTYSGTAISNVNVDIAADNTSVISFMPDSGLTDSNGELAVTVIPLKNGTVNLIASAGGSVAVLKITVINAGAGVCPAGWMYYRDIQIQNNVNRDLYNFQVLITLNSQNLNYTQSDCSDIVFYNGSQRLDRWIVEGTCGTSNLKIWVKVPYIPSNGVTTIRMYYGSPFSVPNSINTFDVVGEAGVVSVGGVEKTVNLQNVYSDPVVFAVPKLDPGEYRSGTTAAQHHLITSVSQDSFTIKQVESPSGDGTITETDVSYIVLEKGVYYIGYDLLAEVGSMNGKGTYTTVSLNAPFSGSPAVLADLQGPAKRGNTQYEDVYARVKGVSSTGFQVQIEMDDNSYPPSSLRGTIAYAAIGQGYDSLNSLEARQTSDSITDKFSQIFFTRSYSTIPSVVAQLVSEDGWNSAYAVTRNVNSNGFEVAVEEPAGWDGPHTTEKIAWVAAHQDLIYGRKYVEIMPTVSVGAENSC